MKLYNKINGLIKKIKKQHGKNFIPYVISGVILWAWGFLFMWLGLEVFHLRVWVFYLLFTPFGWLFRYSVYYLTGFAQRHEK